MKRIFHTLYFICLLATSVHCQAQKELSVGDSCPDFTINNIINSPQKISARISDFRGKVLLLDFWATWCSPCVASFPKMEDLQKKYAEDIQILPVTYESRDVVAPFLKRLQKIKGLHPVITVVEDSILNLAFRHSFVPHYVWINRDGIIVAITGGDDVTEDNIVKTIKGEKLELPVKKEIKKGLDTRQPAFSGDQHVSIANDNLLYHSILTGINDEYFSYGSVDSFRVTAMNLSILQLFTLAYGQMKPEFITASSTMLLIKDTATPNKYTFGYRGDQHLYNDWKRQNLFCYELVVPPALKEDKFKIMQKDLERYFDLKGSIEKRMTKCYVLIRTSAKDKIRTAGGQVTWKHDRYNIRLKNVSMSSFLAALKLDLQTQLPLIDETGYEEKLDLEFTANMSDINSINEGLKKYDLKFIVADRGAKYIVLQKKE